MGLYVERRGINFLQKLEIFFFYIKDSFIVIFNRDKFLFDRYNETAFFITQFNVA